MGEAAAKLPLAGILPLTAAVSDDGHLTIAGCDAVALAREFGTPLYVFDEETLRHQCREFLAQFRSRHPDTAVSYAAKAYLGRALAALLAEEGMNLEVVSGGELAIARSVGFPPERISFHGNNKSEGELREALSCGIGRVAVDNFHELSLLARLAQEAGRRQRHLAAPIAGHRPPHASPHHDRRPGQQVRIPHQHRPGGGGGRRRPWRCPRWSWSGCTPTWARPSSKWSPSSGPSTCSWPSRPAWPSGTGSGCAS